MNIEVKDIQKKFLPALAELRRYVVFIFIIALVSVYGFLVFSIRSLSSSEPSEEAVAEKLQTVQRPKIDQDSLNKIEQLESESIEVKSLINQARQNPFNE